MGVAADLLLEGALVYPGEGGPEKADVAVHDGRILAVRPDLDCDAATRIDLSGLALAPGFIDVHSHCALRPFAEPELECKITQGFTTELINQDGVGPAPVSNERLADRRAYLRVFEGEGPEEWTWRSIGEYLEALDATRPATSLCPLVPAGAVRDLVLGGARRAPSGAELAAMRAQVRDGMLAGAWGLSLGLIYTPGSFAATDELVALAEVAAEHGGFLIPHIRSESGRLLPAVDEMIDVARRSGAALNLTHLKVLGKRNAPSLPRLLEKIDTAAAEGLDVTFDQYPYPVAMTTLSALLPQWVHEGGTGRMLERLEDLGKRGRIVDDLLDPEGAHENLLVHCGPNAISIVDCAPGASHELVGRTLAEVASDRDLEPAQAVIDLLVENRLQVVITAEYAAESTVREIMRHPRMLVGSDGIFASRPHPRLWGTAPRVLGRYAVRDGLLDISEAIGRLSSRAAARIGLLDRGTIAPGKRADLVAFDPRRVIDRATYANPELRSEGICWVLVGGEIALSPTGLTGTRAGGVVLRT